jgi:hypothetical protein
MATARKPIASLRWWIGGLLFASTVINYIIAELWIAFSCSDHLRSAVIWGALGAAGLCNARTQRLVY